MTRVLPLLLAVVMAAGCAQTLWYKAGGGPQEFETAKYYCLRDAGYYTPNPYSPLVQGNNDPSWGLAGLSYQLGQKRQFNDCMRALGWSTTPPAANTPLDSTSEQARVKSAPSEPASASARGTAPPGDFVSPQKWTFALSDGVYLRTGKRRDQAYVAYASASMKGARNFGESDW